MSAHCGLTRARTFGIPSLPVLLLDEVHQCVVDTYTVWEPETTSRRNLIEEPQVLLLSNLPVVTLRSFLEELLVFCELLGIGEGDAVYPLKGVVIGVAEPVRCGML